MSSLQATWRGSVECFGPSAFLRFGGPGRGEGGSNATSAISVCCSALVAEKGICTCSSLADEDEDEEEEFVFGSTKCEPIGEGWFVFGSASNFFAFLTLPDLLPA
jgi:hypothetical protein